MAENTTPLPPHIAIAPGIRGGRPRIDGTGVTVAFIAEMHERQGYAASELAAEFGLSFAEIYAALAYYYDHREEIDRRSAEDAEFIRESMKAAGVDPGRLGA